MFNRRSLYFSLNVSAADSASDTDIDNRSFGVMTQSSATTMRISTSMNKTRPMFKVMYSHQLSVTLTTMTTTQTTTAMTMTMTTTTATMTMPAPTTASNVETTKTYMIYPLGTSVILVFALTVY